MAMLKPSRRACGTAQRRTGAGFASRIMRLSTWTARATSPCRPSMAWDDGPLWTVLAREADRLVGGQGG